MNVLLFQEIKKSLTNKFYFVSMLIAISITVAGAVNRIITYLNFLDLHQTAALLNGGVLTKNPDLASDTLFNYWIGGEYSTLFFSLFYILIPLISAFPYGWSFCIERKSGYVKNVISRTTRKNYFISKYIAVFISGGLAVFIPLLINFILVSCFVPAYMPDVYYDIYYGVGFSQMLSRLFFTNPFVYVSIYLLLNFIFGGLISCLSLAVTFFINNRVAVVLMPFFLLLGMNYLNTFSQNLELSPINFLHPARVSNITNGWIVLLEGVILFTFSIFVTIKKGISNDVF